MATIERALASVRKIDAIYPIDGADLIEVARVGGWRVVVKRGEFQVGDLAIYLEINSFVPHELAPFLSKGNEPKEYNGVKGEPLKSIKLRKQISQGLLLPLSVAEKYIVSLMVEGLDVTLPLGIQKWEAPETFSGSQLQGKPKGNFPTHLVPKTNQERIQNLTREVFEHFNEGTLFEISEKLDGSSLTIIYHEGEFRVCSRNLELKEDENNAFWKEALKIKEKLLNYHTLTGINFAVQGELISSGIQGNPYKLPQGESAFYVFDIFNIDKQEYFGCNERLKICEINDLKHVPVYRVCSLKYYIGDDGETEPSELVETLIQRADGNSVVNANVMREGRVFKSQDGKYSFKCISNSWLLKKGE